MCENQDLQNLSFRSALRGLLTLSLMLHPWCCTASFFPMYLIPICLKTHHGSHIGLQKGREEKSKQTKPVRPPFLELPSSICSWTPLPGASKRHTETTYSPFRPLALSSPSVSGCRKCHCPSACLVLRLSCASLRPCHAWWLPSPMDLASSLHIHRCSLSPGHHLGSAGLRQHVFNWSQIWSCCLPTSPPLYTQNNFKKRIIEV